MAIYLLPCYLLENKMMHIQKKSLDHILEILERIDTYPTYDALSVEMDAQGIDNVIKQRVLSKYQAKTTKTINEPVSEAKGWLKTVISDFKDS